MSCGLAGTGVDATVMVVATVAVGCLAAGLVLVSLARRRRSRAAPGLLLLLLVLGGSAALANLAPTPAMAAPTDCGSTATSTSHPGSGTAPGNGATTSPSETPGSGTAPGNGTAAPNSLTVVQTSTMTGLAPTAPAQPITGLVTNNGPDSTFVTAVDVSITSVVKAAGAAAGACDPSDYVLLDPRMPVGETLAPSGGSATFSGASIGFRDKATNQDACKSATINLLYTANPA